MRWEGGRKSDNLQDRRNMRPATMAAGGLGVMIVMLVAAFMGLDPKKVQQLINNVNPPAAGGRAGQAEERELTPEEKRSGDFAATILAFTEEVWDEQFRKAGEKYVAPQMVLFADSVATGCGNAPSAVGPFYCPADRTVYLDPTFFTELKEKMGGSDAEFSQAYVIAHEIGHHVQNLLGYSDIVNSKRQGPKAEFNRWSVRLELQADYLAGVWAHYGQKKFDFVEPGDVAAAIQSAQSIGDDRIQKNSRGFTSPESYTHGTSAQRTKWFKLGLQTGDLNRLNELFEIPYEDL